LAVLRINDAAIRADRVLRLSAPTGSAAVQEITLIDRRPLNEPTLLRDEVVAIRAEL
jgi:hypothetical protein